MSNKTFEEYAIELDEKYQNGKYPTDSEMRELLSLAVTEAHNFLPRLIDETAHHLGHGDEPLDVIDGLTMSLDNVVPVSGTLLAAVLIHHLATLQNSGVNVDFRQEVSV